MAIRCWLAVSESTVRMTPSFNLELSNPPLPGTGQQAPCRNGEMPSGRHSRARGAGSTTVTTPPGGVQGDYVWRPRNTRRGVAAALLTGLAAFVHTPARAQGPADAPPFPADAMRLYQRLDGWVRAWRVPGGVEDELGGEPDVPGLSAVAVTLRYEGQVVGRGVDVSGGLGSLVLAAGQAMSAANTRLPIERDALFEQHVRAAAERMTVSLELAGPWVPIAPAQWADAAAELAPGLDGTAARLGERAGAVFPSVMLASNMDPGRGLASAVSRATDDATLILKPPEELAKELGATFYRFRATHVAQPAPGEPPLFLHRGGRTVEPRELDEAELRRWADGLAENLRKRRWPGVEKYGLQGTYDPVSGKYEAAWAPPGDQALVALSLVQYFETPGVDSAGSRRARAEAAAILADLGVAEEGETQLNTEPAAEALAWVALRALGADGSNAGLDAISARADELRPMFARLDDGLRQALDNRPHRAAVSVWALARRCVVLSEAEPVVEARLRAMYREVEPGQLVSLMPWLGWAELAWARFEKEPGVASPIAAAVALREMRSLMWEHQLRADDYPFDQRDLAGGIVFTSARNPLPSWQSARPLAFVGTMLGDPRLTDEKETTREIVKLLAALRFLRQLSAGQAEGCLYADPARAMWGVRVSLWDQRMPVDATAMTLMAVCETLRSLEAIRQRQAGR